MKTIQFKNQQKISFILSDYNFDLKIYKFYNFCNLILNIYKFYDEITIFQFEFDK